MHFAVLITILLALTAGCATKAGDPAHLEWGGKLYAGDADKGAITRAQSNESLQCTDSQFSGYVCMTYDDLKSMRETLILQNVTECEK